MIFQSEKNLKDYGDKIPADKRAAIESALTQLKSAYESKDISSINSAFENMNNAWHAASEDMAKAAQQQQGPSQNAGSSSNAGNNQGGSNSGNGSNGSDPGTVDVDYEEVK